MPGSAVFTPAPQDTARNAVVAQAVAQPTLLSAMPARPSGSRQLRPSQVALSQSRGRRRPSQVPVGGGTTPRSPADWVERVLSSPGRPLPPRIASSMGETFDADFSAVRVHEGPDAAASARAVGALMYTSRTHIVMGDRYPGLGTANGRRALAHELYHVKQQAQTAVAATMTADGRLAVSDPADAGERAAEHAAERAGSLPAQHAPRREAGPSGWPTRSYSGQRDRGRPVLGAGPLVIQRQVDDTIARLVARVNALAPSLADQPRAMLLQRATRAVTVLSLFDAYMRSLGVGYRFGGSLAAWIQGATRGPNDIDVEVANRGKMQELYFRLTQPGSGWTGSFQQNPEGQILSLLAWHQSYPDFIFDMASEADPSLQWPANNLEGMQVAQGAPPESGGLVPAPELIVNYLDRMTRKPAVSEQKNDWAQIRDLLISAGVTSEEQAALYWNQVIRPLVRNEHADRLKDAFAHAVRTPPARRSLYTSNCMTKRCRPWLSGAPDVRLATLMSILAGAPGSSCVTTRPSPSTVTAPIVSPGQPGFHANRCTSRSRKIAAEPRRERESQMRVGPAGCDGDQPQAQGGGGPLPPLPCATP
jgi:Domain of unknown function (DUF4157)